jgi:TonB family protein
VLAKASLKMQPLSAADIAEPSVADDASSAGSSTVSDGGEHSHPNQSAGSPEGHSAEERDEIAAVEEYVEPRGLGNATGFRGVLAAMLLLAAVVCLWRSREAVVYLARTPEGRFTVLRESVAALFYMNQTGAADVGSVGSDAQQDAYFSRNPASSNQQTPALKVVATESTGEERVFLPKAPDFPLPVPVFERQDVMPIHVRHAAIPESMRDSAPIERPVVVTVSPAQMMPVSAPQPQAAVQQFSEPVTLSEESARALLVHTVNPVYPPEGAAQKLQGPVVLQAVIARDGSVEDLKLVRGYFILGRAAIAAVKQWRFQPYSVNGHAAATQTVITINFSYPPG